MPTPDDLAAADERFNNPAGPAASYPGPCEMHEQPLQRSLDACNLARAYPALRSRVAALEADVKRLRTAVSPGEIAALNDAAGLCESEANRWENSTDIRCRQTGEHWSKVASILRGDALAARVNFNVSNELQADLATLEAERDRLLRLCEEALERECYDVEAEKELSLKDACYCTDTGAGDDEGHGDLLMCLPCKLTEAIAAARARLTGATNG